MRRLRGPVPLLMLVALGTLGVTALVDFVIWPLVLTTQTPAEVNLLAALLGFVGAVVVSIAVSGLLARWLDSSVAARLEHSDRERRRLLTDLAHEIRTPVSVLDGYLEGIQDGVVTPDAETLAVLRAQTTRLARLTDDVQSVSHAEEGALDLRPTAVDVTELLHSAAAAARRAYADKDVELRVRISAPARPIRADRQRLEQVLANLLSNALRHSDPGGTVELEAAPAPHRRVRISVVDHGDGIEAHHLESVFERFYRTDIARDRDHGGSGIGLTISRAIVTAHDGQMWVESDGPGRGAVFAFTLPVPW
ncbi:sensor histidine kinase [Tsukamurella paurometabola]|uniref:histidine kinase n=1 Tax=Tsukamurella paurometabola TaxID=2061 RepID=A0A3P8L199_TSUPA|nr:HAMP domain-containing sensor histidine kinase [Tsukamurella paurometabola]MBS4102684.1 hypothetical protein [Tsukamurella paurometabola]UEA81306.1 HAMP domain-containing histidine kinase [Tsukamurella paurometabola]VDR38285.1 Signal transduction histidine-protein kinase BaeS [Tsukamurella paurometabola]